MNQIQPASPYGGVERFSPAQNQVVARAILTSFSVGLVTAALVGTGTALTIGVTYTLFFKKRSKR